LLKGLQSAPGGSVAVFSGGMAEDRVMLQGGGGGQGQLAGPQGGYEAQINNARTTAQQDPKRVAQVVKGWVGNDG
jgi:flagellar M-ring protein FliF